MHLTARQLTLQARKVKHACAALQYWSARIIVAISCILCHKHMHACKRGSTCIIECQVGQSRPLGRFNEGSVTVVPQVNVVPLCSTHNDHAGSTMMWMAHANPDTRSCLPQLCTPSSGKSSSARKVSVLSSSSLALSLPALSVAAVLSFLLQTSTSLEHAVCHFYQVRPQPKLGEAWLACGLRPGPALGRPESVGAPPCGCRCKLCLG